MSICRSEALTAFICAICDLNKRWWHMVAELATAGSDVVQPPRRRFWGPWPPDVSPVLLSVNRSSCPSIYLQSPHPPPYPLIGQHVFLPVCVPPDVSLSSYRSAWLPIRLLPPDSPSPVLLSVSMSSCPSIYLQIPPPLSSYQSTCLPVCLFTSRCLPCPLIGQHVFLSVYLPPDSPPPPPVLLSVNMSSCPSIYLQMSPLSSYQSTCLPVRLCTSRCLPCPLISQHVFLSVYLPPDVSPVLLSVNMSSCPSIYLQMSPLSSYQSTCLPVRLCTSRCLPCPLISQHVFLSVCVPPDVSPVLLSVNMSSCPSVYLQMSPLSSYQSTCLPVRLFTSRCLPCPLISQHVFLSVYLPPDVSPVLLSVNMSSCPSIYLQMSPLSSYQSTCLPVRLCTSRCLPCPLISQHVFLSVCVPPDVSPVLLSVNMSSCPSVYLQMSPLSSYQSTCLPVRLCTSRCLPCPLISQHVFLSVCVPPDVSPVLLSVNMSSCPSVYLQMPPLSSYQSTCLPVRLFTSRCLPCPLISQHVFLSVYLPPDVSPVLLSVNMSSCPSIYLQMPPLSSYQSTCLPVRLCTSRCLPCPLISQHVFLSVCVPPDVSPVLLSVNMSSCPSVYLQMSPLSSYQSTCLPVRLCTSRCLPCPLISQHVFLSVCVPPDVSPVLLSVNMSSCPSTGLPNRLSVCLSVCQLACQPVCPSKAQKSTQERRSPTPPPPPSSRPHPRTKKNV